jgi:hypothetical protein
MKIWGESKTEIGVEKGIIVNIRTCLIREI